MSDPIARSYLSAADREELPALTGLRILAALAVAVWHGELLQPRLLPPFTHGYLGVDLFFILSGFIIAHVYWRDFLQPSRHTYLRFVALRLARLWPAHVAVIALYMLLMIAIMIFRGEPVVLAPFFPELGLHLFLAQNWGFIERTTINFPSWSVSAEFLAYLLFPLQVAFFRRIDNLWLLGLSIPLAVLVWLVLSLAIGTPLIDAGPQSSIRVVCEFAMGVALWRLWRSGRLAHLPWTLIVAACALAIFVLAAANPPRHLVDYLIVLLMAPLLLGVAHGAGVFGRVLASRPLVYLGEISYSIYLMHLIALILARSLIKRLPWSDGIERGWDSLAIYLLLSFAFGALVFHLVEKPARLWLRARIDRHMLKPAVA